MDFRSVRKRVVYRVEPANGVDGWRAKCCDVVIFIFIT